jgi:Ca-activated chloride channel homolog
MKNQVAPMFVTWQIAVRLVFVSLTLSLLTNYNPLNGAGQTSLANPKPTSIAIVIDVSDSTDALEPRVKQKQLSQALLRFVQLNDQSEYFLIRVSTTASIFLDSNRDATTTSQQISRLVSKRREGGTALYDGCYLGVEKVVQGAYARRVLVVVSDGFDTMSHKSLQETAKALVDNKVKLYSINVGSKIERNQNGMKALHALASVSGGVAFYPKSSEDLNAIVDEISARMRE